MGIITAHHAGISFDRNGENTQTFEERHISILHGMIVFHRTGVIRIK